MNEATVPLPKEFKILLLKILKKGSISQQDVITFSTMIRIGGLEVGIVLTDEQFKEALEAIKPKNMQTTFKNIF